MNTNKRLKIVLFALTGFGNKVLEALNNDLRVEVGAVFTVKYDRPFPYYPEKQLIQFCEELEIPCFFNIFVSKDEGIEKLREIEPDLIFVATFKQIIKNNVINLPPLGVVNFHPSLLPAYRGACPTNAVLRNGEGSTGVTAHYVTEELDKGDILLQRSIPILDSDFDGQLRFKLANLAGAMVPEVVGMFASFIKPAGIPQRDELASYAPKPTIEDGYLEQAPDVETICRKIRAYNPIPGTSILVGDERILVDRFLLLNDHNQNEISIIQDGFDLRLDHRRIRLFAKNLENS